MGTDLEVVSARTRTRCRGWPVGKYSSPTFRPTSSDRRRPVPSARDTRRWSLGWTDVMCSKACCSSVVRVCGLRCGIAGSSQSPRVALRGRESSGVRRENGSPPDRDTASSPGSVWRHGPSRSSPFSGMAPFLDIRLAASKSSQSMGQALPGGGAESRNPLCLRQSGKRCLPLRGARTHILGENVPMKCHFAARAGLKSLGNVHKLPGLPLGCRVTGKRRRDCIIDNCNSDTPGFEIHAAILGPCGPCVQAGTLVVRSTALAASHCISRSTTHAAHRLP